MFGDAVSLSVERCDFLLKNISQINISVWYSKEILKTQVNHIEKKYNSNKLKEFFF